MSSSPMVPHSRSHPDLTPSPAERGRSPRALRPIQEVAEDLGFSARDIVPAGRGVVRLPVLEVRRRATSGRPGKLVLVTAMTPTEHGEGKTVVAIGLAMALRRRGRRSVVCLRQPSLGPVFGTKGGATGGGASAVEPRTEIDLGFTGDLDAITNAQNLLATFVDNHLFQGNALKIDPTRAVLPRASPLEDRSLRDLTAGLTVKAAGFPRPAQFVITPACEMAAIHGLATDYADLKQRIDRMTVARTADGSPIRAADLGPTGGVPSLLRYAMEPNLVQTSEGTPALVHGVPYANVAHGTCSRLSMDAGVYNSDFCVVEAGFSSDLGAEKFVDVVSPQTHHAADVAVVVASLRAIRWHGTVPGREGDTPDPLGVGLGNLEQHVENVRRMGLDPIVAINRFPTDTPEDLSRVARFCDEHGLRSAVVSAFADGGRGAEELADRVIEAAGRGQRSHPLYGPTAAVEEILATIVTQIYGGGAVELSDAARDDLDRIRRDGGPEGPVCIAKTPLSLSADAKLRGRPRGFTVSIRRLMRWTGAGFTVAIAGPIVSMPGLPAKPAADAIRMDDDGVVTGMG
ncbi:MAG TPA: formate--tetrahydrofolate ligase [Thermoplasmata archaeon]|nr:formate--tetrahydrofolate ligase [Thermoplasmata archaeon]